MPTPRLGSVQAAVLASLKRHGSWHERSGWLWDTRSNTIRILNRLVAKGCATLSGGVYKPRTP